jgi:hypothetical protein
MSAHKSTKDEKQVAVSKAILEIIERDGLLGVTHSKISRKSSVSRAWIYEYIGKEKSSLVEFAAEIFAGHFARVKTADIPKTKEQLDIQLKEGVSFLFDSVAQDPMIIKLYFRFRGTKNPVGNVITKYEEHWLKGASKCIVDIFRMSQERAALLAELVLILRLGFAHRFATSSKPQQSRKNAEEIFAFINSMIPS